MVKLVSYQSWWIYIIVVLLYNARYEEFAKERGREVHNMKKSGFIFYAGDYCYNCNITRYY